MAEFKLGRIRFIWKGDWTASTVYYKDDIIRNGGNTYVCTAGHTSSIDFPTDLTVYWNKMSDGQEWKGNWTSDTYYKVNDIVKYGGYLYIANEAHTSAGSFSEGLEADQSKWDLFAEGFDWKGDWLTSFRYKINDLVKYNGTVYLCNEEHTSASTEVSGLEADQSKWDIFSEGFVWQNVWLTGTRYRVNDIVRYGGTLYVCVEGHTSAATAALGLEDDQSKWEYLHKGIEYKGTHAAATRYKINDVVKYGGALWICTTYHTSQTLLSQDESKWDQFVEGLEFEDSWDAGVSYQPGDFVTYGGYSYVSVTNNRAVKPTESPADWDLFTTGFRFLGEWGDDSSNFEYKVGDVVRLGGYTYLCTADHSGERPPNLLYWERLNYGFEWKNAWANGTLYDLGDAVRYGVNTYVCIQEHTSDQVVAQNRPDQDVLGTYWNLLSGGVESGNLTTQGDLVYYGGAGPTRLAIGQPGQVLKVNDVGDAPEWGFWGRLNNIYYVQSITGIDDPAPSYGTTLDRPWKTIRYAAEQILKGALRPAARELLERNRSFIQAEVAAWVAAQITGGAGIWAGFVNDDPDKCARDMGQILDAVIWDISHGGNKRIREATLSYFSGGSLIAAIADEDDQLVAAVNYMVDVIDAVLTNFDPAVSYQGTITQDKDLTLVEESDAQTLVEELLGILTNAVTAGTTTGIPAERIANDTIFVKTGTFAEILPIIVPANCAVVGDELRSTRIEAAGSFVDPTDTPKTLDAMSRLESIISNVVRNIAVTPTTGNTETQVTTRPAGSVGAGTDASALVREIIDYINWGVNGASGDSTVPLSRGSNTPETSTGYTYAVETLEANREFIKAELLAYIAFTYPAYTYDTVACARDVDRYIDAIKHDLIYTGNYKSLLAARYYVNAVNGSTEEDMFYMRNGTGLRNCTVAALSGTLSAPNAYGTRRPSAGAYVSLDPGWGPNHIDAWITNKSPYVQNVTTFGTACVGLKVDGDLHAGGNDSIVANDFTQVLSDGIGCWITNLGRAELVSVFSYYGHIGYLAENGGKIRATNGNSSYGAYGTVAEGVDETETPIVGAVDNRTFDAVVTNVLTNGSEVLTLEFLNAGESYTSGATSFTITGEGFGAATSAVNVSNGGVFEIRLLDPANNFGGEDYVSAQNVAIGGNTTSITLSNTDTALSTAYTGMAIFIIAGKGAGQYGYINSYNSGTKIAQIYKCSDGTAGWDHVIGSAIEATLDDTTQYIIEPRLTFTAPPSALYANTAKARARVEAGKIVEIRIWDPGSGYLSVPTMTITDPNNTAEAPHLVRIGNGVLKQPTWSNRGTGFTTAQATVSGDGYADMYQPGQYVQVKNLSDIPQAGSNVVFGGLSGQFFKLVSITGLIGSPGSYEGRIQISPDLTITDAPEHEEGVEMRIRYSQVRLTGHDFLDIGTGNFANTNYPGTPLINPDPTKETNDFGGGRVFYTSTDQDGNFRVGSLFSIEQSTGIATLNADAFNISGLQELQLGAVSLGGTSAVITEFSTDGTFTADSDNIVPTQKAIKTYIASQIGGGAGELNVNSITAGLVQISTNEITTTSGVQINTLQKVNFQAGIDGHPLAMNYFLLQ